jgi:hypothetical protein
LLHDSLKQRVLGDVAQEVHQVCLLSPGLRGALGHMAAEASQRFVGVLPLGAAGGEHLESLGEEAVRLREEHHPLCDIPRPWRCDRRPHLLSAQHRKDRPAARRCATGRTGRATATARRRRTTAGLGFGV